MFCHRFVQLFNLGRKFFIFVRSCFTPQISISLLLFPPEQNKISVIFRSLSIQFLCRTLWKFLKREIYLIMYLVIKIKCPYHVTQRAYLAKIIMDAFIWSDIFANSIQCTHACAHAYMHTHTQKFVRFKMVSTAIVIDTYSLYFCCMKL